MPAVIGAMDQARAVGELVGVAVFSHGVASLAFLGLGTLLLGSWRTRPHAAGLGLVCLATALWGAGSAGLLLWASPWSAAGQLLEIARSGAWLVLLVSLLEPAGRRRYLWLGLVAGLALGQLAAAVAMAPVAAPAWLARAQGVAQICRLLQAVLGMLLVEQWYRNTPPEQRWGSKFACLGIAALFACDFYLYSDSLLLHRISGNIWSARGLVDALCVPLLAVAMGRSPAWALGLAVSRHLVLRSVALLGSAIYLLAMASCAYYLRYVGGAWGPVMQLSYLGAAMLLLACVLFSGAMRARLKVFISKHFYRGYYDYRQEWLRFTRALAAGGPALGERTVQALAQLVESPAGALWIRRDAGLCEPAASWNLPPQLAVQPAGDAFCQFMEARQWVIELAEARRPQGARAEAPAPAWLDGVPQLWLVVPLMLHGGLFGFVALTRPRVAVELNWEVRDLLKIAGSQAAGYLAHRESAESLLVARQFESFNRMSAFVVHDVKNLVFQLSLLLRNAEQHKANPVFQQDMLETLEQAVKKMSALLQRLHGGEVAAPAHAASAAEPVRMDVLLEHVVAARASCSPAPRLELRAAGLAVQADPARLERVLGHLLQNAIEATAKEGCVVVRLLRQQQSVVVELSDTGQGMSAQFVRERLFKPFDTTKPAGMGIGVFESREYIRELGGQLEVASEPAVGTTFRVILPLCAQVAAA